MKIYKYGNTAPIGELFTEAMPEGSVLLDVAKDSASMNPAFWALVPDERITEKRLFKTEKRQFIWIPTGQEINDVDKRQYIGSAHCGPFVWHLFEHFEMEVKREEKPGE